MRTTTAIAAALGVIAALGVNAPPADSRSPAPDGARATPASATRPNIVVLMLDDTPEMGTQLLERMPALRRTFVEKGIHFRHHYGNDPLCCPGRANFLTGLYTHHHGVVTNDVTLFDPMMTIATALQDAAYHTLMAGKYLNGIRSPGVDKTPPGWDHVALFDYGYYDVPWWIDGRREFHGTDADDYSTDVIRAHAVRWLRQVPSRKPFFALLTPFATHGTPHDPFRPNPTRTNVHFPVPAQRHIADARCDGVARWRPGNYNEEDVSDKPDYLATKSPVAYAKGWPLVRACESLLAVDEMFRAVRRELAVQGRKSETIFILTADNGMAWGSHRWTEKRVPFTTHSPLWVSWPTGFGGAARTIHERVTNVDLAPTLARFAGATLGPYATGQAGPDGRDIGPLLLGTGPVARDALLEEHRDKLLWWAIRTTMRSDLGLWHYVEWDNGARELYDVARDPDELENLAGHPDLADTETALARRLSELRAGSR
jgi:arylsulfatase A-like enzyme